MKNIKDFEVFNPDRIYESMENFPEDAKNQKTVQNKMYNSAIAWLEKGNLTRGFKLDRFIEGIKDQGAELQWSRNKENKWNNFDMWLEPDMTYTIWIRKKGESSGTGYEMGTWYFDNSTTSKILYVATRKFNEATGRVEDVKK